MRHHYVLLFLSLFLLHEQILLAQDPIFSQFSMNKLYLNPAMTGLHLGTMINVSYRDQWRAVRKGYSQFKTNSIGVSTNIPCMRSSFGLIYNDNVEGEGLLRWQNLGGSFAFSLINPESKANSFELKAGMRISHSWRTLNWGNLVFGDQLDALEGVINSTQIIVPNNATTSNQSYWDAEAGLVLSAERIKLRVNAPDLIEGLQAGIAVAHLIPRNHPSFLGAPEYVPMRFTVHFSWLNTLAKGKYGAHETRLWLNPLFKMDIQGASKAPNTFNYLTFNYGLGLMTNSIYGGVCVQNRKFVMDSYNTGSLILNMGYAWEEKDFLVRFGVSKDFNVRGLSNNANGAWEFSLVINPRKASFCTPGSPAYNTRLRNICIY